MKKNKIFLIPLLLIFGLVHINSDELNTSMWISADVGLKMRDAPNLSGEIICVIPYTEKVLVNEVVGKEIALSGATGKWCRVVWKNKEGWVFGGFLAERPIQLEETANAFVLNTDSDFINFAREAERRYVRVKFIANPVMLKAMGLQVSKIRSKKDVYDIMSMYWHSEIINDLWKDGSYFMPDGEFGFYGEGGTWLMRRHNPEEIKVEKWSSTKVIVTVKWNCGDEFAVYIYTKYTIQKTRYGWKVVELTEDP
ncbi:MAG: SH3 domain-containing protein [Spirochaetales bacterium]|nr:SH3 domain-containing protein [Spirochaetales bacterium]